ncbi:MAG: HDOD domain-containing protein [Nitrospirota bacterium]|nr:HDOD domain-containing protein [Nitrospirota bacterium]
MRDIQKDISGLKTLSTIPVVMKRLLETISDENSSFVELSEIIQHDQSLSERVVAIANAPYFWHSGLINNLEQATLLLGYDLVRSIAISISVFDLLDKDEARRMRELWAHSYEVGIIAGLLCDKVPVTSGAVCFLGGLLHDIGRVIFYTLYAPEYRPIMFDEAVTEKETGLFDADHSAAGGWFLEYSLFPEEIISAVRHHHSLKGCERHKGIAITVHLAEALSSLLSPRNEADGFWSKDKERLFYKSGLKKEDMEHIGTIVRKESPLVKNFFEM